MSSKAYYYLHQNEEQIGPFTIGQLKTMWQNGSININTHYCTEGSESWGKIEELVSVLEPQPTLPLPPQPRQTEYRQIPQTYPPQIPSNAKVGLSYIMALLIPFVGIIMGIILLTKSKIGHGIAVIVISLFWIEFWFNLLNPIKLFLSISLGTVILIIDLIENKSEQGG